MNIIVHMFTCLLDEAEALLDATDLVWAAMPAEFNGGTGVILNVLDKDLF
jgi:hypothetical protein